MLRPSFNFLILFSRRSRYLLADGGLEAMASASVSDKPFTAIGEKIFSKPRTICRSITYVVILSIKVF